MCILGVVSNSPCGVFGGGGELGDGGGEGVGGERDGAYDLAEGGGGVVDRLGHIAHFVAGINVDGGGEVA